MHKKELSIKSILLPSSVKTTYNFYIFYSNGREVIVNIFIIYNFS